MRSLLGVLAAALAVVFAAPDLAGQVVRPGLLVGMGVGGGSHGVEGGDSRKFGLSGYLTLGGAVNDLVLLGAEANTWIRNETREGTAFRLTSSSYSAVAYLYPDSTAGFFLKGGIGLARFGVENKGDGSRVVRGSDSGTAFTAGMGCDIKVGSHVTLVPYWALVYSRLKDGTTSLAQFGLGVTWQRPRA